MLPTRLERACLRCALAWDLNDRTSLHYWEDWLSEDDLRHRVCSERFNQLISIMEASAGPPEVEFLLVAEVRGLAYIEALRRVGAGNQSAPSRPKAGAEGAEP